MLGPEISIETNRLLGFDDGDPDLRRCLHALFESVRQLAHSCMCYAADAAEDTPSRLPRGDTNSYLV